VASVPPRATLLAVGWEPTDQEIEEKLIELAYTWGDIEEEIEMAASGDDNEANFLSHRADREGRLQAHADRGALLQVRDTGLTFAVQPWVQGTDRRYRVDFIVFHEGRSVAVELDGHDWRAREQTEKGLLREEARRERRRWPSRLEEERRAWGLDRSRRAGWRPCGWRPNPPARRHRPRRRRFPAH
jgi:hypothetical protein